MSRQCAPDIAGFDWRNHWRLRIYRAFLCLHRGVKRRCRVFGLKFRGFYRRRRVVVVKALGLGFGVLGSRAWSLEFGVAGFLNCFQGSV